MISPEDLVDLVVRALPGARVSARDLTGTADHYELVVIWSGFDGQSLLDRHQRVYAALSQALQGPLHAVTLKTYVTAEAPQ